jgi:replicative DNA helicase
MVRRSDPSALTRLLHHVDAVSDGTAPSDALPTGFPSLDRLLGGGLRPGDLVVLGGDVGAGKSSLGLAMAMRLVQAGRAALVVSGEMRVDRLLERLLAIEGRTPIDDLRRGALDEVQRATVGAVAMRLREAAPVLQALPADGLDGVAALARAEGRGGLVVVDGLAAFALGERPLDEELAAAVRRLKAVALEANVALLLTAGLPGFSAERRSARPRLDDFGVLGAIKQHADVVLALFREEMYDPGFGVDGATELHVLKNRNGQTGYVDLYFYKRWMRFEDMLDPDR